MAGARLTVARARYTVRTRQGTHQQRVFFVSSTDYGTALRYTSYNFYFTRLYSTHYRSVYVLRRRVGACQPQPGSVKARHCIVGSKVGTSALIAHRFGPPAPVPRG